MRCSALLVLRFDANCFALFEKQTSFFVTYDGKQKTKKRKRKKTSEKKHVFYISSPMNDFELLILKHDRAYSAYEFRRNCVCDNEIL